MLRHLSRFGKSSDFWLIGSLALIAMLLMAGISMAEISPPAPSGPAAGPAVTRIGLPRSFFERLGGEGAERELIIGLKVARGAIAVEPAALRRLLVVEGENGTGLLRVQGTRAALAEVLGSLVYVGDATGSTEALEISFEEPRGALR